MSDLIDFKFPKASKDEAEAGISNSVLMTPLRTAQAIDKLASPFKTGDVTTTAKNLSAPDWLLTDGAAYLRSAYPDLAMLLPAMSKLSDPATLPANTGYGCAFS